MKSSLRPAYACLAVDCCLGVEGRKATPFELISSYVQTWASRILRNRAPSRIIEVSSRNFIWNRVFDTFKYLRMDHRSPLYGAIRLLPAPHVALTSIALILSGPLYSRALILQNRFVPLNPPSLKYRCCQPHIQSFTAT